MSSAATRQFERYTDDIYGWAYRLVGRHHDALDVVQDVFLRWAEQCGRQPPDSPRGWLRRVTLNRSVDLIRRRRAESDGLQAAGKPEQSTPEGLEPADVAALRDEIAGALAVLTDAQRSVLIAKVYDGQTFAQIAADLGVAVPTVKTHYLRAVRAVRDRLGDRWSHNG